MGHKTLLEGCSSPQGGPSDITKAIVPKPEEDQNLECGVEMQSGVYDTIVSSLFSHLGP